MVTDFLLVLDPDGGYLAIPNKRYVTNPLGLKCEISGKASKDNDTIWPAYSRILHLQRTNVTFLSINRAGKKKSPPCCMQERWQDPFKLLIMKEREKTD